MPIRTILLIGGLLLLIAAIVELFTVRQTLRERAADAFYGQPNVLRLTNAVMNQTEGNTLRIRVWSDEAIYTEDRGRAHLTKVRFIAYPKPDAKGRPQEPVEGTANAAEVESPQSRLELSGKVHIHQGEQTEMRGERLVYDYKAGLLTSRDPVWMRHGQTFQEGNSLRYRLDDQKAESTRPMLWQ